MVRLESHLELLDDQKSQSEIIGERFYKMRKPHLKKLTPIETYARQKSTILMSYDKSRTQPPFFNEFTYGELLGCLYVSPQSLEAACQIINKVPDENSSGFDIIDDVLSKWNREGNVDKYALSKGVTPYKEVVFVPGSNIFTKITSREILTRLMIENEHVMIKLHPLTNDDMIKQLGIEFGYHRIIGPLESGSDYLKNCETCHVTTSTEMGLYGIMMGKEVNNVSNFFTENIGTFYPIYRELWKLNLEDRQKRLRSILNSDISGIFHPDDPEVKNKIDKYFEFAMQIREKNKPLSYEYSNTTWGNFKKEM